jgi:hypothetical protein
MERAELVNELHWRRCKGEGPTDWEACLYFLQTFAYIRHPERGRILFELREAQRQTLEVWLTERYSIVLKARQIGYSTLAACVSLWLSVFYPDKVIILLSRTERESQKLFAKAKYCYRWLPQWMKDRGPDLIQETLQKFVFDNESQIECLPSTQDPARGESAYLIIVDEWAFLENPEEAWASIEPVADVGGRVIGLSTANGAGTFYEQMWTSATEGANRFTPLFFPWSANSDRDEDWYENKKADMARTPWILWQEYPRNAEEAFIRSGRAVFDLDAVERQELMQGRIGELWAQSEGSRYAEFHELPQGELTVYEFPTPGCVYAIGADVAEGLDHGDYSCAVVLDARTEAVCAVWHGHCDPDVFANVLWRLGHYYLGALLGVESNNHGMATLLSLKRMRYPKIYRQTNIESGNRKKTQRLGWRTMINTKPILIDGIVRAIRGYRQVEVDEETDEAMITWTGGMAVRDAGICRELRTFVREPDGKSMHGSPHDDRVIALGLAIEMCQHVHAPQHDSGEMDEFWTLKWWEEEMTRGESRNEQWVIGQDPAGVRR